MKRVDVIECIMQIMGEEIVVSNLGYPSRELFHVRDRNRNFYMLGSMGLVSSIGLGLALADETNKVLALDGDGSILMNLGSLATIANQKPENLILVIIDNKSYGTTGGQPSYTAGASDIAKLALAAGIRNVQTARTRNTLKKHVEAAMNQRRLTVIVVKAEKGNAQVPRIPLSAHEIKTRFMEALRKSKAETAKSS